MTAHIPSHSCPLHYTSAGTSPSRTADFLPPSTQHLAPPPLALTHCFLPPSIPAQVAASTTAAGRRPTLTMNAQMMVLSTFVQLQASEEGTPLTDEEAMKAASLLRSIRKFDVRRPVIFARTRPPACFHPCSLPLPALRELDRAVSVPRLMKYLR